MGNRAVDAGKHVLSEKPVGATTSDVKDIVEACRRNNVQFMDGVMFMHSRRLGALRRVLDDGQSVGTVRRITSQFTFGAEEQFFATNIRGGSDLSRWDAWATWVGTASVSRSGRSIGSCPPGCAAICWPSITAAIVPAPVPTEFSGELFYADGVSASFHCSFLSEIQQWASVAGTKGAIYIPDFVLPHYGSEVAFEVSNPVFHVSGCDFNMEGHVRRHAVREYGNSDVSAQETNMFWTFAELATSGSPDPHWGEVALKTQQVVDGCLRSARSGGEVVDLEA